MAFLLAKDDDDDDDPEEDERSTALRGLRRCIRAGESLLAGLRLSAWMERMGAMRPRVNAGV